MSLARAELESLLRARRLDRTLTTALPSPDATGLSDEYAVGCTGVSTFDARLGGGFPRGQLSEITGPRSSGRMSVCLQLCAAATARGELVAIVDVLDMFDAASASAAGVDLTRLLWIRGHVVGNPGLCRDTNQRAMEQAIRALTLVLTAGNFGVVAFDVGEAPADAVRRLPFTTWLRLQRLVEGSPTVCVLIGREPMARSSAGLTLRLGSTSRFRRRPRVEEQRAWNARGGHAGGDSHATQEHRDFRAAPRLFEGLTVTARIVRARARAHEETGVDITTIADSSHA